MKNRALLIAFIIAYAGCACAEDAKILVSGERLGCVQKYIDSYIGLNKNPVVIILPECPNTEVSLEILSKYPQAYGGVDLGSCEECDENEAQNIISLTKKELTCLAKAPPAIPEKIYDISKIDNACK